MIRINAKLLTVTASVWVFFNCYIGDIKSIPNQLSALPVCSAPMNVETTITTLL